MILASTVELLITEGLSVEFQPVCSEKHIYINQSDTKEDISHICDLILKDKMYSILESLQPFLQGLVQIFFKVPKLVCSSDPLGIKES